MSQVPTNNTTDGALTPEIEIRKQTQDSQSSYDPNKPLYQVLEPTKGQGSGLFGTNAKQYQMPNQ